MNKQKHESEYGVIEYRLPSIPESLELLAKTGEEPGKESAMSKNGYYIISKVMANMGFLIEKVYLKVGDKEITTLEEAVHERKLMAVLCEVAARISVAINGGDEEKKS